MKRRLNKKGKIAVGILIFLFILLIMFIIYKFNLAAPTHSSNSKEFTVDVGDNYYTISKKLKDEKLIKSEFFYKMYIKLHKPNELKEGVYKLDTNMNVKKIVGVLSGNKQVSTAIRITFQEGLNIRQITELIVKNTENKEEDVNNVLNDKEYLNSLIKEYWFITEDILDKNIYYPLEGYLYPNTYEFVNKKVTVKEIFKSMLDETGKQLENHKTEINNSTYNIHQILTLSSIVELEAKLDEDRPLVAGVIFNRLKNMIEIGSDVTTYYGLKLGLHERDLAQSEIEEINAYNTRAKEMKGKLPVGPICNPSITAIEAVLNPDKNDYYYFVADKNGKTYFTKTYEEHQKKIKELKESDLWYTY